MSNWIKGQSESTVILVHMISAKHSTTFDLSWNIVVIIKRQTLVHCHPCYFWIVDDGKLQLLLRQAISWCEGEGKWRKSLINWIMSHSKWSSIYACFGKLSDISIIILRLMVCKWFLERKIQDKQTTKIVNY